MTRWIPTPMWSRGEPGPRVLVEVADFAKRGAIERILEDDGCATRGCGGPEGTGLRCPVADGEHCLGVVGADLIVHSMRHSDPRNREVLRALRERYPDVPVVVEAPAPIIDRHPRDFDDCHVIFQPMTAATLLAAVRDALAAAEPPARRVS